MMSAGEPNTLNIDGIWSTIELPDWTSKRLSVPESTTFNQEDSVGVAG